MASEGTRTRHIQTSTFWHIILPILTLIILMFVLFVIYTMPDWALTCSSNLESIRRLATRTTG